MRDRSNGIRGLCSSGRYIRCEPPKAVRRTLIMSLHESTHGRRHEKLGDGDSGVSAVEGGHRSQLRQREDSPHGSAHATGEESEEITSDVRIESSDGSTADHSDERQVRSTVVRTVTDNETGSHDQTDGSTVRSASQCIEMQSRVGCQSKGSHESHVGCSLSEIAGSRAGTARGHDGSDDRTETDPWVAQASGYLADGR